MISPTVIAILVLYLTVLLVIGVWASRTSKSMSDYYAAGKKLPSWVIAVSSNATGESAWLLLGLTGMGYMMGVHALWIVLGEVLGVALGWVWVALPFKEYTNRYDSITVPDYLEARFRDRGHALRLVSFVIIFLMVTAYIAAQLTASGKAFGSFLHTSYTTGIWIGAAVIVFYTALGGLKAVAYCDLFHGILMFSGLATLPLVGVASAGGWTSLMTELQAADPNLLLPMGAYGLSVEGVVSVLSFLAIGVFFLGAPQLLTRFISARDRGEIVDASVIAVVCVIVFDVGAVLGGMAGRALFPGLADPETILPTMSTELFPAIFTGIFLVVVLAAILSTVDSLLILASSAVMRDVVQKVFRPDLSDERLSFYGKLVTVIIGAGALILALGQVRMIFWFVLFAVSGLATAFVPVILCSLYWKRTTRAGAVSGMIAGFLTAVSWALLFKERFYDLYEMIPGIAVGFGVIVVVSWLTCTPEGAEEEYEEVWNSVRSDGFRSRRGACFHRR